MFLSCVRGIRIKLKASDTIDFLALTLWNIHCDRFQRKYSKLGEYLLGPGISIPVLQNISEKNTENLHKWQCFPFIVYRKVNHPYLKQEMPFNM